MAFQHDIDWEWDNFAPPSNALCIGYVVSWDPPVFRGNISAHECVVRAIKDARGGNRGRAVRWLMAGQCHNGNAQADIERNGHAAVDYAVSRYGGQVAGVGGLVASTSEPQDLIVILAQSREIIVKKLDLDRQHHDQAVAAGIPTTLWLGVSRNKEYPPLYRHAWGAAIVSTRQDMGDRYPVDSLRLRIEMPALTGPIVDDQTRSNSAECPADCKFAGTIFGDFSSSWSATATHANFGTWSNNSNW